MHQMKKDMNAKNCILGIGGIALDITAHTLSPVVLHDSNPGSIRTSPGGVTRNICENLARMGTPVAMLSVVGQDAFGDAVTEATAAAGVNMDYVLHCPGKTASYLAVLDSDGDLFVASSDFSIMEELSEAYLLRMQEQMTSAAAIVTDANMSREQLELLIRLAGNTPLFLDPVSEAKSCHVADLVGSFTVVKPNAMELAALSGMPCNSDEEIKKAASALIAGGCRAVAVSLGKRGCFYIDCAGNQFFRSLGIESEMVNAVGAGDAFLAGFISGYHRNLSPEQCIDRALAAGLIATQSPDTIHPEMSDALLDNVIRNCALPDQSSSNL